MSRRNAYRPTPPAVDLAQQLVRQVERAWTQLSLDDQTRVAEALLALSYLMADLEAPAPPSGGPGGGMSHPLDRK